MKRFTFIVFLSAAFGVILGAETLTLTVKDSVEAARARNLELKQSGITLRTLERSKNTAWNAFLPGMTASAGFTGRHGLFSFNDSDPAALTDPGNLGVNAGLNLALPLNIGVGAGVNNRVTLYEAGVLDYEAAVKQLERDVKITFYNLLAIRENIDIQEANIDLARRRYEQAVNNFRSGLIPEFQVLSAEVTLTGLQPAYNKAAAAYESLLLKFKILIGADPGDKIVIAGQLPTELYTLDAEQLINRYAAGRLDIRKLDKQIEAREYSRRGIGMKANTPTLNLGWSYGLRASNADSKIGGLEPRPIDPWSDWSDSATLSIGLSWKFDGLIPGSKTHVQLKELQDGIDSLKIAREIAWNGAAAEIINLVSTLLTSRLTIEANTSRAELARRNFELIEEAYNVGTRELLDVEKAQNDFLAARQELLLAKYQYAAGLLKLEYALNAPMDEFLPEER